MDIEEQSNSQDEYHRIFDKAVKLLALRMHTKAELGRKLLRYKPTKEVIGQVLERLTELKALDDEGFAEIYLDNLIRYKTFGYYGLKAKLLSRGITSDVCEKLLQQQLSLDQEEGIAKKISSKGKSRELLAQSLSRKGFRSEVISRIMKNSDLDI